MGIPRRERDADAEQLAHDIARHLNAKERMQG